MGILDGIDLVGWSGKTRVVFGETEGASSLAGSLKAGELITLPGVASVAKSLGALTVSRSVFERCRALGPELVRPFVMSDAAAVRACMRLANEHRLLVEPACGAALAAVTERSKKLEGCKTVVVEVCGGAITSLDLMAMWARDLGIQDS